MDSRRSNESCHRATNPIFPTSQAFAELTRSLIPAFSKEPVEVRKVLKASPKGCFRDTAIALNEEATGILQSKLLKEACK